MEEVVSGVDRRLKHDDVVSIQSCPHCKTRAAAFRLALFPDEMELVIQCMSCGVSFSPDLIDALAREMKKQVASGTSK